MIPLPTVDQNVSCDDCGGSCCRKVGSPPGWLFDITAAAKEQAAGMPRCSWTRSEWGASLPEELFDEMLIYVTTDGRRYDRGLPCLWLDEATGRCRHYDLRPDVCKEFDVGGEDCIESRRREGVA